MDNSEAVARALVALHAQLQSLLPDVLKLEELLRTSLTLQHDGEVVLLLQERQQQCVAAVTLLRGLPAGAAGREAEGLQALLAAKPFIESSSAMIRDVLNLLHVVTGPQELAQQPSLGTTVKTWRQHGIQIVPRPASRSGAAEGDGGQAGNAPADISQGQQQQQHHHHQQQQQQQQQPQQQLQQQQQQPAPLGLTLLIRHQQQQQLQDQQVMPPPPPAPWARPAHGAGQPLLLAGVPGDGPTAGAAAAQPLGAELLFSPSMDFLPVLPSTGVLPTLSQLLEEPMMTLSLHDGEWGDVAAAAAAHAGAAAGSPPAVGSTAVERQQQQQAQAGAAAGSGSGGCASTRHPLALADPLGNQELSMQLLEELLMPVPAEQQLGSAAALYSPAVQTAGPPAAAAGAAGQQVGAVPLVRLQQAPPRAATVTTGPTTVGALQQQAAGGRLQQPPSFPPPAAGSTVQVPGAARSSPFTNAVGAAAGPVVIVAAPGQSAAAKAAAEQLTAVQLASAPALAGTSAPLSPGNSLDQPQTSGGSGSLSYRRVSFAPLQSAPRSSTEIEIAVASSRVPSTATMPFMRPPVAGAAGTAFLARPPVMLPPSVEPAPVAAAGTAAPPACAAAAARVSVVQAGTAVRIAQSAAAAAPPEEDAAEPKNLHCTIGTAEGPISYVSVHEAPPHDFSQGETSLTRLFATVKATGMLPLPEDDREGREETSGSDAPPNGRSRASSASAGTTEGSGSQGDDTAATRACAEGGGRQTRQQARRAQQAAGNPAPAPAAQQADIIAGTKRRKAGAQ